MADIAKAYKFLNDSLKLGLTQDQLDRAEIGHMQAWLKEHHYPNAESAEAAKNWEFFAYVKPTGSKKA